MNKEEIFAAFEKFTTDLIEENKRLREQLTIADDRLIAAQNGFNHLLEDAERVAQDYKDEIRKLNDEYAKLKGVNSKLIRMNTIQSQKLTAYRQEALGLVDCFKNGMKTLLGG
jgi:hypothetical protein